jgi:hypothetical protein
MVSGLSFLPRLIRRGAVVMRNLPLVDEWASDSRRRPDPLRLLTGHHPLRYTRIRIRNVPVLFHRSVVKASIS